MDIKTDTNIEERNLDDKRWGRKIPKLKDDQAHLIAEVMDDINRIVHLEPSRPTQ